MGILKSCLRLPCHYYVTNPLYATHQEVVISHAMRNACSSISFDVVKTHTHTQNCALIKVDIWYVLCSQLVLALLVCVQF